MKCLFCQVCRSNSSAARVHGNTDRQDREVIWERAFQNESLVPKGAHKVGS